MPRGTRERALGYIFGLRREVTTRGIAELLPGVKRYDGEVTTVISILDESIDLDWWAAHEVEAWLRLMGIGKMVTGAQRDRDRYRALRKVLDRLITSAPDAVEVEVFEEEGFRVKFKLPDKTEVGRLRITGPDFDPAFAWPEW